MGEDSTKFIDMVTCFKRSLKGDVYDDMAQTHAQMMLNIAKAEDILNDKLVINNVKVTSTGVTYGPCNNTCGTTNISDNRKYINIIEFKCVNCGANELKDNVCVYCGTRYKVENI